MNIAFENRSLNFRREALRQSKLIQEHAECIVSDVLEDVGQIASAEAQICLKSKETGEHGVSIGATAEISVFYITEGRDCIRCMRLSKSFETDFECPAPVPEAAAQVSLFCQGVQARVINPRKIGVQFTVRADLCCWIEDDLELPINAQESESRGLQLRREETEGVLTVELAEKSFVISEQLALPAQDEATQIVFAKAELQCRDCQTIGSKALVKGGAELRIVYETREGTTPSVTEQCVPFSVLFDMPDENCGPGRVRAEVTAVYASLSDAINGSRVIELEVHGVAQICFEKSEKIAYISDAYSTRCPVSAREGSAALCLRRRAEKLSAVTSERIGAEAERGEIAACRAELISFAVKEGTAAFSASVSLLLRGEDGGFSAQQRLLSLETSLPEAGGEITAARLRGLRAERQGDEIALTLEAEGEYCVCDSAEIRYLSALELDEENAFDASSLPSLTVAKRSGRDLWELAKLYHSSEQAIAAFAEKYPMGAELVVIPRV